MTLKLWLFPNIREMTCSGHDSAEYSNNIINNNNNDDNKINKNEKSNIKRNSQELSKIKETLKLTDNQDNKEYTNKNNKILKKYIMEEEENMPLIPKDKINDTLKSYNKKNKIFIIIISIIILISIIFIAVKFTVCMIGFEQSRTILRTTIDLEMLKVDIYTQAILSILYCINITKASNIHSQAKTTNKMTIEHFKIFQEHLNTIINYKYCGGITKILIKKLNIYNLNIDWTILNTNTYILEEINKLSYKAYSLTYNNESCSIASFYEFSNRSHFNFIDNKVNSMQQLFFYFLANCLTIYRNSFEELSDNYIEAIEKHFANYQNIIFYLLICIIVIIVFFIILYIIKSCYDNQYYQILFLHYYNIENEQLKFEYQIYYLYKTIEEFNLDNINYFEYIKNNTDYINFNDENNYFNQIKNNNNATKNNLRNSNHKKKNKRNSASNKSTNEMNKNKNVDQNSINIQLLNGTINGSSLHFLNNSNKININNNIQKNNNINNSSLSNSKDKYENEHSQEESMDSMLEMSKKILPNSIKISLNIIILGSLIYLILLSLNIYGSIREKKQWNYSINLSMNILERIPRLMEMLIYSCITVITNNIKSIEGSIMNEQSKYLALYLRPKDKYTDS